MDDINYKTEDYCSILKEYLTYHEQYTQKYEKCIILMLVGSFYEIYAILDTDKSDKKKTIGPDLYELSDLLNVYIGQKKTKKTTFSMIGFPDYTLHKYRNILLNQNYTLVIVDQVTPAPNPERAVVEILSPGTIIETYDKEDSHYLISIYINRFPISGHKSIYSVGFSVIDISTGKNYVHKIISSLEDEEIWSDEIYRFIHYYSPKELLIHFDVNEIQLSKEEIIHRWLIKNVHLNIIDSKDFYKPSYQKDYLRKVFPHTGVLSPIEYLGFERDPDITISYMYMIQFIYEHKMENVKEIFKPIHKQVENYLVLSHSCLYQLYIVDTHEHVDEKYSSLMSLLNQCSTSIGRRLLKERLLYPILDPDQLNKRYDEIQYFQEIKEGNRMYAACIPSLRKILDIEKSQRDKLKFSK